MLILDVRGKKYVLFGYDLDIDDNDSDVTPVQKAVYYYVLLNSLMLYMVPVTPTLTEVILKKVISFTKEKGEQQRRQAQAQQTGQQRTEYDVTSTSRPTSISNACSLSVSSSGFDVVKFVLEQREEAWNVYKRAVSGIILSIKDTTKHNLLGDISSQLTRQIINELITAWAKICNLDNIAGIGFALPSSGVTPSVSYSNQYMNSPLEDFVKSLAGKVNADNLGKFVSMGARLTPGMTRQAIGLLNRGLQWVENKTMSMMQADEKTKQAVQNMTNAAMGLAADLLLGATVSLPKVWADFSITMSHSIAISLAASNIKQYVRNILLPYIMLLPFATPITGNIMNEIGTSTFVTLGLSAFSPLPAFVTCPGVFTVPLGIIFNMTRNVQTETIDMHGKALRMDVQLTINDSIESLMIPEASLWRQHRVFVMPQIGYALWGDVQVDPVREYLYEYLQSIQPNLAVNTTYHKIPTPMQPTTDVNKQLLEHSDKVVFGA